LAKFLVEQPLAFGSFGLEDVKDIVVEGVENVFIAVPALDL
jgi:hypothetical protein